MHDQIRKTSATAIAALTAAAAIAGCGGSSDGDAAQVGAAVGPQNTAQVQQSRGAAPSKNGKSDTSPSAPAKASGDQKKSGAHRAPQAAGDTTRAGSRRKRRESLRHILTHDTGARRDFVLKSAPGVLKLLGFKHAVVRVDREGTAVTVLIDAGEVCGHSRSTESKIRGGIKRAIHFVRRVDVLVGEQSFTSYATANCKPVVLPNVSGQLVYSASGHTGDTTTEAFKMSGSNWTVAYENDGSFLTMFLLKDDKYQAQYFSTQTTGTGKQTFKGHGTFKLRVSASGDWRIKVYD